MGDMPDLLTTAQLADLMGVDRSVIIRRVTSGALVPALTLPGRTGAHLFDPSHLEQDEDA